MNAPIKYCIHCTDNVETRQIGRKIHCTKCNRVIDELPIDAVLIDTSRPVGFGSVSARTRPRGTGWGSKSI